MGPTPFILKTAIISSSLVPCHVAYPKLTIYSSTPQGMPGTTVAGAELIARVPASAARATNASDHCRFWRLRHVHKHERTSDSRS